MIYYQMFHETKSIDRLLNQRGNHRSTKHTYTTKDRITRAQLKTGGELSE